MHRNHRSRVLALAVLAHAALLLGTPERASALSYANGDLIVFFVKNGFELIVNAGPAPSGSTGVALDPALALPAQFGGSLDGALWGALSVRSPDLKFTNPDLFGAPQSNLILTTNSDPAVVQFGQVADAQAQLQPADNGSAWFALLKGLGVANGSTIIENGASRLVIATSLFASYTGNLGFGTNAVANTLPVSTASVIAAPGGDPIGNVLPLYELLQDITIDGSDLNLGTAVRPLGQLFFVPEPGTVLLLGGGLLGLAGWGRRRPS